MKSVKVIIETPKGSTEKYAYDKEHGLFALKKILPAGRFSARNPHCVKWEVLSDSKQGGRDEHKNRNSLHRESQGRRLGAAAASVQRITRRGENRFQRRAQRRRPRIRPDSITYR